MPGWPLGGSSVGRPALLPHQPQLRSLGSCIFFFASAASSSAYLTASEIFPLETRALAISCFYALGTAVGGGASPLLFGWLIKSHSSWKVAAGYLVAALLLLLAAICESVLGVDAEGKSLERIADPLSGAAT